MSVSFLMDEFQGLSIHTERPRKSARRDEDSAAAVAQEVLSLKKSRPEGTWVGGLPRKKLTKDF